MKIPKILLLALLSFPCLIRADLVVSGGHLVVSGGKIRESDNTDIQNATVTLQSGSELISPDISIGTNGILRGCGLVTSGTIENEGLILANCGTGSALTIHANLDNRAQGVIRAENDTGFTVSGVFFQNGILDLIFSPSSPPAGISGTGTTVTATTLPAISLDPGTGSLTLPVFAGHSYQIQYTDDLAADPVVWTNHSAPIAVTSAEEDTVTVPLPASGLRVYRYRILE